jgi:hypothetical protein
MCSTTSTRRTSGHCLGTFQTGDIVSSLPPKCSVSHCLPTFSLLLSLNQVSSVRESVKKTGSWKGAAIQRRLERGSCRISTVRSRYQGREPPFRHDLSAEAAESPLFEHSRLEKA